MILFFNLIFWNKKKLITFLGYQPNKFVPWIEFEFRHFQFENLSSESIICLITCLAFAILYWNESVSYVIIMQVVLKCRKLWLFFIHNVNFLIPSKQEKDVKLYAFKSNKICKTIKDIVICWKCMFFISTSLCAVCILYLSYAFNLYFKVCLNSFQQCFSKQY